jgi:prepilin-type N-terminal cleavage/methylation domain-containing protein
MAGDQFIRSSSWILNAKRRQSLLASGLTPGVKARGAAFTLIELLIVVAVVLVCGVWVAQEHAKLSAPLVTGPLPCYDGGYVGIGITLKRDEKSNAVRISKIIPDSPAALAKLSPGLVIEEIDGVTTYGKSPGTCQLRLRGKAGTKVCLKLVNPDRSETYIVELTRQILMTSNTT